MFVESLLLCYFITAAGITELSFNSASETRIFLVLRNFIVELIARVMESLEMDRVLTPKGVT